MLGKLNGGWPGLVGMDEKRSPAAARLICWAVYVGQQLRPCAAHFGVCCTLGNTGNHCTEVELQAALDCLGKRERQRLPGNRIVAGHAALDIALYLQRTVQRVDARRARRTRGGLAYSDGTALSAAG